MSSKTSKNSVHVSTNINDIIEVNKRSASAKDFRIIELGSLSDLIPEADAESIRRELLKNKTKVKQLTNQRVFEPWTKVKGFVETCMDIRYIPPDVLPIETEVLIFDDTVAIYQVKPSVSVTVINNPAFAAQQKAFFDNFWAIAERATIGDNGGTTISVTIKRSPEDVYKFVSNLANWPLFSDFAANFERVTDDEYIAHTSQGDINVKARFDCEHLLLDNVVTLPDGNVDMIPYRVVPNKDGAELMMTNFKPVVSTKAEYEEQLEWMDIELKRAKEILESKRSH